MKYLIVFFLCCTMLVACKSKSPEQLPKFKQKFKAQITAFEKQKVKTDQKVEEGVQSISGLETALQNAQNVDQEFNKVYTKWKKVDKEVEDLYKEYEDLQEDANNLFDAMDKQTESLNDAGRKTELKAALSNTKNNYNSTLGTTQTAIDKLKTVHGEAIDIIKALEVAVALNQISEINSGLKNIETKVSAIMKELNKTITESKGLYEKRAGSF